MTNAQTFFTTARSALAQSAKIVRKALFNSNLEGYEVKDDRTLVTKIDLESQKIITDVLLKAYPDSCIKGEEGEENEGNPNADLIHFIDPLDGTGIFVIGGASPTVIIGQQDAKTKQLLGAAVIEPSTGRAWLAYKGAGTFYQIYDQNTWSEPVRCHVNEQVLDGAHILIDILRPHPKKVGGTPKDLFTQTGRATLSMNVQNTGAKEKTVMTNGGQYALLAWGRPRLAGVITTCAAGPHDVCALLLVEEAGGVARSYTVENKQLTRLENAHDIETAEIVIAANSKQTIEQIEALVRDAVSS